MKGRKMMRKRKGSSKREGKRIGGCSRGGGKERRNE